MRDAALGTAGPNERESLLGRICGRARERLGKRRGRAGFKLQVSAAADRGRGRDSVGSAADTG
jgi:hypothetical protein